MPNNDEKRRCARVPLEAEIEFRRPRQPYYSIKLCDLAPHGCRLACPERLAAGDLVWVQMPSLESLPAWVRWTGKAQSGVEFDRPIHFAVFDMMAGRLASTLA